MDLKFKWKFNIKDMPDMGTLQHEVDDIAKNVTIGTTLFMKKHGVSSEKEYKEKMMKEKKIMKHSAIGYNSWQNQEEGIRKIYGELKEAGSYIDRYGACMDWVMGVPEAYKSKLQAGSGLILKNEEEWARLGQVEPIQPHLGDHMIGSLNSLNNTMLGLKAGVTTIGNISHYYTYEYPGLDMEEYRTTDMVKAIGLMARLREKGTIIHSNLDDGFGAQFHDLANLVGYAKLERYICEELLGARMAHCFGNLFNDPMVRIIFNSAMGKINTYHTPGTMIYGNTIDFGFNMPKNYAAVTSYAMADAIGQMICPSGHAITPIPVTEAIRVPAVDEIIDAHNTVDMAIEAAAYYKDYVDVQKIEAEADLLVACGNVFFERVLNGLDDQNIDINHAGEVLAALKAIGVTQLETYYGVGKKESGAMRGRVPVRPTSIVKEIDKQQTKIMSGISGLSEQPLKGINVIVASTDVHEFGKEISKNVLVKAGAEVFDLGTTVAIEELADTIIETGSEAVLISTYNGIAYSFAKGMMERFNELNIDIPIVMGGRLNEPMDGNDLPVDVAVKLSATHAAEAIKAADLIIIAVLPLHVASVTSAIGNLIKEETLVLSIAAGVTMDTLEGQLGGDKKIARVMPNTLSLSGKGYSTVCLNSKVSPEEKEIVTTIINGLGKTMYISEEMFDTFTAFSCSGPMWLYKTADALINAGVYEGFSRSDARNMVLENMLGAAALLQITGDDPSARVNEMCFPGGVTIEGFKSLQEQGFDSAIMTSVDKAVKKAKSL